MHKAAKYLQETYSIDFNSQTQTTTNDLEDIKEKLLSERTSEKIFEDDPINELVTFIKLVKDKKVKELVDLLYEYENSDRSLLASEGAVKLVNEISEPLRKLIQKKYDYEFYDKLFARNKPTKNNKEEMADVTSTARDLDLDETSPYSVDSGLDEALSRATEPNTDDLDVGSDMVSEQISKTNLNMDIASVHDMDETELFNNEVFHDSSSESPSEENSSSDEERLSGQLVRNIFRKRHIVYVYHMLRKLYISTEI